MKDSNAGRRVDWHDENYRVWLRMFKRVGWDAKAELSNFLMCDSNKRPDIVIFKSLAGGDIVIDYITCVVGKSDVVDLAATTPLHAADAGATTKCNAWEHLVQLLGVGSRATSSFRWRQRTRARSTKRPLTFWPARRWRQAALLVSGRRS